ncbi:MAG TPA: cytochrome d ubiquinol oxidase subunit II, partial [Anaeromyxobacteraceae bacterium]|nr:cytochrome d ubiquinol oxidase subunit II [Anaeromyxobacteraceae bacterium]
SRAEAPVVFEGLTRRPWSAPLVGGTAVAAAVAFVALRRGRVRLARAAAAIQVALIVAGWGAAQHPYLVVPGVTLASASAPRAVQVAVLWALAAGSVLLFPALYLLFRIFKGERPFSVIERK